MLRRQTEQFVSNVRAVDRKLRILNWRKIQSGAVLSLLEVSDLDDWNWKLNVCPGYSPKNYNPRATSDRKPAPFYVKGVLRHFL